MTYDHTIDLKLTFIPKIAKVYPLNPKENKACQAFIDEHLETGCIIPSKSLQAAPFFFVPKKDGSLRPCQDYWYLNSHTIWNACPLPLIPELINDMKDSILFTKFNIHWGYNNIWIHVMNQWKAAFITPFRLFEPTVMFFSFCNAPSTFGIPWHDHWPRTSRNGPIKLTAICNWKPPASVKGIRSFLGFANFYHKFIPNFSHVVTPLNLLTWKDQPWAWTPLQQKAFDTLHVAFSSGPVLSIPDVTRPFSIMTDAFLFIAGAVLLQDDTNGNSHPCTYFSKTFIPTEQNYDIYDWELLAVILSLEEWKQYVQGTSHPVTIITNHKNLSYIKDPCKLSQCQAH